MCPAPVRTPGGAERYASAARTVVHLIVGPARDERCVVLSLSCGARLRTEYPQRYCTLRMPVARPGWRYRRPGKSVRVFETTVKSQLAGQLAKRWPRLVGTSNGGRPALNAEGWRT